MRNCLKSRLNRWELSQVIERRINSDLIIIKTSAILIDRRTSLIDIKLSRRLFIGLIKEILSVIDKKLKFLSFFAISRINTSFLNINNPKLPLILNPILFNLFVVMIDWSCWKFGDEIISCLTIVEIIDVLIPRADIFKRWIII